MSDEKIEVIEYWDRGKGLDEKYVHLSEYVRLQGQSSAMSEALVWCEDFFLSRDRMNAKIHCAPLRLSPITERVILALGKELPTK